MLIGALYRRQSDATDLIDRLRLGGAAEALAAVRPYVGHEDRWVRSAALAFLWDHGGPAEADILLARLAEETDEELLEVVIDTLAALGCAGAVPALTALAHDLDRPPAVRRAALDAANEMAFPSAGATRRPRHPVRIAPLGPQR
jgi:HEAT repeat protein